MSQGSRGRRWMWFSAAALVGVVGIAGLFRREITARWYLHRLRTEPEFLLEAVQAPDASTRHLALELFIKEPEGRRRVVDEFVAASIAVLDLATATRSRPMSGINRTGIGRVPRFPGRTNHVSQLISSSSFRRAELTLTDVPPRGGTPRGEHVRIDAELAGPTLPSYTSYNRDRTEKDDTMRALGAWIARISRLDELPLDSFDGLRASIVPAEGEKPRRVLLRMGPEAVPRLRRELGSRDGNVAETALLALAALGPEHCENLPSPIPWSDKVAVDLGELGARVLPLLDRVRRERNSDTEAQLQVLGALFRVGPASVPIVDEFLDDPRPEMVQAALFILRQLGPSVSAETPRIASFLRHADVHVRREAATALTRTATIYHAGEIVVIADALGDEDALVRFRVAQALGNFGAAAAPALPHLIAALDDPGDKVRAAAARSLGEIGNDTKRVVDALTAKLDDDDGRLRNYAAEALEHLRTETP